MKPGSRSMPVERLDRERRAGDRRAQVLGRPRARSRSPSAARCAARARATSQTSAPLETIARPCDPTYSKTTSVQRSGRPVTKTTGTPSSSTASSTSRCTVGDACRRSGPGCRRGRWRPAEASSLSPPALPGSGRAITSSPSSLAPRSSVKPHFASTRTLALLVGSTLARTRTPAASVSTSSAVQRLGREAPAARLLDQPVADLGLGHAVGRVLGRAEEADRAERGRAADDVARRPRVAAAGTSSAASRSSWRG